jgi:protein arginine N-methyltransferase 2
MYYINQQLTFDNDMIYFLDKSDKRHEVMMSWEDDLMKASADFICQNGGHILEIGFGMGISANYIQQNQIASHTIIENHPDIIPKALAWAEDKPNVTIVQGSWYDVLQTLGVYDGIFYDTYGDEHLKFFPTSVLQLTKTGTLLTFWNTISQPMNIFGFENVEYDVFTINPPKNSYFEFDKYYLPKIVIE